VPAWKASRVNLTGALKQGGHTSSSGTALPPDTVENRVVLAAALLESHEGRVRRTDAVLERLRARPDVLVAGAASSAPFAPGALSLGERLVADGASCSTRACCIEVSTSIPHLV
jgi:hypothetical protein